MIIVGLLIDGDASCVAGDVSDGNDSAAVSDFRGVCSRGCSPHCAAVLRLEILLLVSVE